MNFELLHSLASLLATSLRARYHATIEISCAQLAHLIVSTMGGFALLPFLWCVNAVWFFAEAFWKPPYEEQKDIRKYVILSTIGTVLWTAAIIAWVVIFQTHRAEWGEIADRMSFIIPNGMA